MAYYLSTGSIGPGVLYQLAKDHLQVAPGALVASTDNSAVTGRVAGNSVSVQGTISAALHGIDLMSPINGGGHRVAIFAPAMVQGADTALTLQGKGSDISNWGVIDGGITGIYLAASGAGQQRVMNFGIITAGTTGIKIGGATPVNIENIGTVSAFGTAIQGLNGAAVKVTNSGSIYGDIQFGSGRDIYDGTRGGIVSGTVYGGAGDDRFFAGMAAETFDGGTGFDTVVFGGSRAVWASLDNSDLELGPSTDDVYLNFEALIGGSGDDILSGNRQDNRLVGRSGNDRLIGLAGDDTLIGGRGVDTLEGGEGADVFVFGDLRHAGDVFVDFTSGTDVIQISAEGFGLTLPPGPLDPALFASYMNPNPDALFYYTGGPLYFDRDGAGTQYQLVKLAMVNAEMTAADIIII